MSEQSLSPRKCVEKWDQLLEGLDDGQKLLVAWVTEKEARFLTALSRPAGRQQGQVARSELLKHTFPAIRFAIVAMFPASAVDRLARIARYPVKATAEEVHDAVREALAMVALAECEIAVSSSSPASAPRPLDFDSFALVQALAHRVLKAICAYPMEPGRTVV